MQMMNENEFTHREPSLKQKLVAAVANNDEMAARELRFPLKMEREETLRGSKKSA